MTEKTASAPVSEDIRAREAAALESVPGIIDRHRGRMGGLIAILEEVQSLCGYLPEGALRMVAEGSGASLADVYAVATFYSYFSLKPRGRHLICACLGTACHVRGGARIVEEFERQLEIKAGETTDDMLFTLETVNCLGACALGPVVVIDGIYHSKVRKSRVRQLIEEAQSGPGERDLAGDKRIMPVFASCPHCNHGLMDAETLVAGYPSIRVLAAAGAESGSLRVSSLFGARLPSECEFPCAGAVEVYCPHCHERLDGASECGDCGAPVASMIVLGGGALRVCSRPGCPGAELDLA